MTVKERMDALKEEYLSTTSRARRDEINAEIAAIASESPKEASDAFAQQLDETVADITVRQVRNRIGPMYNAINWTFVARTYFHKSGSWLSQRLNGNIHNGKPARFTAAEAQILEDALKDIAERILKIDVR